MRLASKTIWCLQLAQNKSVSCPSYIMYIMSFPKISVASHFALRSNSRYWHWSRNLCMVWKLVPSLPRCCHDCWNHLEPFGSILRFILCYIEDTPLCCTPPIPFTAMGTTLLITITKWKIRPKHSSQSVCLQLMMQGLLSLFLGLDCGSKPKVFSRGQ